MVQRVLREKNNKIIIMCNCVLCCVIKQTNRNQKREQRKHLNSIARIVSYEKGKE